MKRLLLTSALALFAAGAAVAQTTVAPVGQTSGGAINPTYYANNSDPAGFNDMAISLLAVPATSTAQAVWTAGAVTSGTVIPTRTVIITACSGTTGPTLPAVQRYVPISVINRSGGSCLIWPSIGTTVETALGTDGASNAAFTMLTNTDIVFRPIPTAAGGVKWVQ
jgi:hypothetical protein